MFVEIPVKVSNLTAEWSMLASQCYIETNNNTELFNL